MSFFGKFVLIVLSLTAILYQGNALCADPLDGPDCQDWKLYFEGRATNLIGLYQSQMTNFSPSSKIYQAMANHLNRLQDQVDDLETAPCPEQLIPAVGTKNWSSSLVLSPSINSLSVYVHGTLDFPASLPARDAMEQLIWPFVTVPFKKTSMSIIVSETDLDYSNRRWMTNHRRCDYMIRASGYGQHNIYFSGTNATVSGGHLGQCHLAATEDIINHHQGSTLTIHWPMDAIYLFEETINGTPLRGLNLNDLYRHYQPNYSGFLARVKDFLNGDPNFSGFRDFPDRILDPGDTLYWVTIQINGQNQETFGTSTGKAVTINLISD